MADRSADLAARGALGNERAQLRSTNELVAYLIETHDVPGAHDRLQDVARGLGPEWTLEHLFRGAAHGDDLGRYYLLHGPAYGAREIDRKRAAWDASYGLLDDARDFLRSIRPDLKVFFQICDVDDLPESRTKGWSLEAMRCEAAWDLPFPSGGASRGEGILIGHPDTGYTDHPQFEGALDLQHQRDEVDDDDDAHDPLRPGVPFVTSPWHGTITGTTIAGRSWKGVIGVAPRARIVPIRAMNAVWHVFGSHIARAIDDAVSAGACVISMSLGGAPFFDGTDAAIDRAVSSGVIVVAAAGNCVANVVWPAQYANCVAVAATNAVDLPWKHSSHGPKVFVTAPGESVWAGHFDKDKDPPVPTVDQHQGTSLATANVAGVAALWLAHYGRSNLIARYGQGRLQSAFLASVKRTARVPAGWDRHEFGCGIIDAAALLGGDPPDPRDVPPPSFLPPAGERPRPSTFDTLSVVAQELTPEQLRANLGVVFGDVARTSLEGLIERYGPELSYAFLAQPDLREQFVSMTDSPEAQQALLEALRLVSSDALRRSLAPARVVARA